jgi:hypothetical protein
MSTPLETMTNFLKTYPKEVTDHLRVIENDNGYTMLHISNNKDLFRFVPRIGFNQVKSEDRTIPRVCVARTLAGCILSYQRTVSDSLNYDPDAKRSPAHYYIKRFEYKYTLAPDKELVCDVDRTGEEWLVAYSPETACYVAINTGELFVYSVQMENVAGKAPVISGTFLLHTVEPLCLDYKTTLQPGYYSFVVRGLYGGDVKDAIVSHRAIHPDEYAAGRLKATCATMPSLKW